MTKVFKAGCPNFPANQAELDKRLAEIERLINNVESVAFVNIKFSEAAFQLMQDCDLITESNIRFLCDPAACKSYDKSFFFIRNRREGVLRPVEDDADVLGDDGFSRFYPGFDRRLELNGQKYLLVNDWYKDGGICPNKRSFYNWLAEKAQAACEEHWAFGSDIDWSVFDRIIGIDFDLDSDNTVPVAVSKAKEPDDLKAMLKTFTELITKVDNLTKQVNELNKEVKALHELWK